MEMGKLTAKLRDAVPICFLVEGKEVKRYKNIEIPDELNALEYQDFRLVVPLSGAITFKVMFEPGELPEEFPQTRERRTRKPMLQGTELQVTATAAEMQPQYEQAADALPESVMEVFAQALEDAQAVGEPVANIAAAMADGEAIKAEIIRDEATGRVLVIAAAPKSITVQAQLEGEEPAKKLASKGKGKKGAGATDSADR